MTHTGHRFNPAPGWPTPEPGWTPPEGWTPPADWPPAPAGWQLWNPQKKSHRTLIVLCVVGVLAAVGAVAAVSTATPSTTAAVPDYSQTAAVEPSPPPADTTPAAFGDSPGWVYNDGLAVSVLSVRRYRIGPYAAGMQPGEVGVKVAVRITNRTAEAFDLAVVQVTVKAGPDGTQASSVYDEGMNDFTGTVAVGHSATATYAFGVLPGGLPLVDVEVTPSFTYTPVTFEGAV